MTTDQLRQCVEAKQWDVAWQEYHRLCAEGPATSWIMLAGSHAAFGRGDLFAAYSLAEKSLAAIATTDPPNLLGKVRFHLGTVSCKLGDYQMALEQFRLFLDELPILYPELSMGEGKAWFYIALICRDRRRWDEALNAYNKAIDLFRRDDLDTCLCQSLQNLAWVSCLAGEVGSARTALTESRPLAVNDKLGVHQSLGEAYLAVLDDHLSSAVSHLERILTGARADPSLLEAQAQAAWLGAKIAMAEGQRSTANTLAQLAMYYATESKEPRLMNDASALRRELLAPFPAEAVGD